MARSLRVSASVSQRYADASTAVACAWGMAYEVWMAMPPLQAMQAQ